SEGLGAVAQTGSCRRLAAFDRAEQTGQEGRPRAVLGKRRPRRRLRFYAERETGFTLGWRIHTVSATSVGLEVAMPSGYPWSRSVRRGFFDLVCGGETIRQAARQSGVSYNPGWEWWRDAGAMKLRMGRGVGGLGNRGGWSRPGGRDGGAMKLRMGRGVGGLAKPGDWSRPGGRGRRMSYGERVQIMRGRDAGLGVAEIAEQLGRDRTTVWRELRRNRNPGDGDYHATMAHAHATERARRPKEFKLTENPLCAVIEAWMDEGWSPKLIAEVLARDHPDDRVAQVSPETIYKCLYVQTRGSLRA